jgi:hypothetical protein
MICSHQNCNGKHAHKWPYRELCPAAREKRRLAQKRYVARDPGRRMITQMRYRSSVEGILAHVRAHAKAAEERLSCITLPP